MLWGYYSGNYCGYSAVIKVVTYYFNSVNECDVMQIRGHHLIAHYESPD